MKVTIDASVVIKWFVAEERHEEARTALGHRIERHAPDFVLVECANVLWKKARRGEIADPGPFLQELLRLGDVLTLHPVADLLPEAAETAMRIDHPVYDCLYVACSERTDSALLTDDGRLASAVSKHLPGVPLLRLDDPAAIAKISSAATRLIIDRDRLEELIEAARLYDRTWKGILDSRVGSEGPRWAGPEKGEFFEESPAARKLLSLVRELSEEERIDLLALGWFAIPGTQPDWERNFAHACRIAGSLDDWYVAKYGHAWRDGLELLRKLRPTSV